MSNRRKSKWERTAQMQRNHDNHITVKKDIDAEGKPVERRFGTKKYFTMQRKILANMAIFNRDFARVKK